MTVFERRSSGVRSDHSAKCTTTAGQVPSKIYYVRNIGRLGSTELSLCNLAGASFSLDQTR